MARNLIQKVQEAREAIDQLGRIDEPIQAETALSLFVELLNSGAFSGARFRHLKLLTQEDVEQSCMYPEGSMDRADSDWWGFQRLVYRLCDLGYGDRNEYHERVTEWNEGDIKAEYGLTVVANALEDELTRLTASADARSADATRESMQPPQSPPHGDEIATRAGQDNLVEPSPAAPQSGAKAEEQEEEGAVWVDGLTLNEIAGELCCRPNRKAVERKLTRFRGELKRESREVWHVRIDRMNEHVRRQFIETFPDNLRS